MIIRLIIDKYLIQNNEHLNVGNFQILTNRKFCLNNIFIKELNLSSINKRK
jgi:hypothetical protein